MSRDATRNSDAPDTQATNDPELLEVARYDILLPCRTFEISYKLAVLGRVSLTGEFLLRLVKAVDAIDETKTAAFFGFDQRDMAFVLSEVEERGFVERRDGRLRLTQAGSDLFRNGGDVPEIYEVESRNEKHHFDLISLAPQSFTRLTDFEMSLPELKIDNPDQVSSASGAIPEAFRKFYHAEILPIRDRSGTAANKKAIYSIDGVKALGRSSALITVSVRAHPTILGSIEPDLSEWRPQHELDERTKVVHAVSTFVEQLKVGRLGSEADAFQVLGHSAPDFLKEFIRSSGFSVERYFKEAIGRAGEARSDRQTIPIVGAITTSQNWKRLRQMGRYARRRPVTSKHVLWLKPNLTHWGATELTPRLLESLQNLAASIVEDATDKRVLPISVCLSTGDPEPYLRKVFDRFIVSSTPLLPSQLEIMLVPGLLVVLLVHSPLGPHHGFPIPLGIASFDERVLRRVHELLAEALPRHANTRDIVDGILGELEQVIPGLSQERQNVDDDNQSPPASDVH